MVDRRLLVIACLVVNDTQVDVRQELSSHVRHLFVPRVVVDSVTVEGRVSLSQLHVVYTDAVVCKGFSMHVADCFTNLQELLVGLDSLFEFTEVVVQNTC